MPVLADLPHPAPFQGLVYFIDDAWPGAPAPAGFVISDWDGNWNPIPFATLAGFLLINKNSTADMKTYLSVTTSDVTGLSTALAAKANLVHTHAISDVTGLQTALDGKAALVHTHAQSDVTGLVAALAAKEPTIAAGTTSQYWRGDKTWQTLPTSSITGPTTRTLSLGTAYQATDPTKPALVTVNLNSTASLSLTAGTTNTAQVVIGSTNAVASGTGTVVGDYSNSLTGTLVVGLALNTAARTPITVALPAGWYFAIRQTSGTVTITSAFDQAVG